jgi:hypothetical protein
VEVVEEGLGVVVVVEMAVEEEAVEEEVEEEEANRQQPRWPLILPEMASKGYHPPFSEEIPRCSIHSSKNGNYIEPPTLTMTT